MKGAVCEHAKPAGVNAAKTLRAPKEILSCKGEGNGGS